jgi:hypothetical protein
VGSADIINGEVITDDISDSNGVRSADVRDDTLNNGGLQAADLRADSVGSSEVSDESLGSTELAPDSVGSSEVATNAIGSSEVATGAIGSDEVATDAVGTAEIVDGSVGNPDLGDNSVNGATVFPSSLTGADILTSSLTASDIAPDAVGASEVAPNAVGGSEVANGSLGTAELASSIPAARVTRTSDQGILNGTVTALNFNSERYDTAGMHSNSSNLSRVMAPVDGIYMVTLQVHWELNGSGSRALLLEKNGTTVVARDRRLASTDQINGPVFNVTNVLRLSAGDFVEAFAFQDSGGTLNVVQNVSEETSPELSMTWLAPGP